jgi:hypothetical protein
VPPSGVGSDKAVKKVITMMLGCDVCRSDPGALEVPFKVGDRVEVIDDIGRHFQSHVGIVTGTRRRPMSVAQEIDVRLADGVIHRFFDFQLCTPPATPLSLIFDSATAPGVEGVRDTSEARQMLFRGQDIDLHLRVTPTQIRGQFTSVQTASEGPLITLLINDEPWHTITADNAGDFALEEVPLGTITLEIFVPGRRFVLATSM